MKDIYESKDELYYKRVREDLINLLPKNNSQKILEIGSGGGNTIIEIKSRGLASEVVGIDLFELEQSHQKNPLIDRFILCNLETDIIDLPFDHFDVIIAGDVLEHLVDPWMVIKKLTPFLKKGGKLIVSVPNIREISTMCKIFFKGDFDYNSQGGILDKTHLRFFCKKNVNQLFDLNEFRIDKVYSIIHILPVKGLRYKLSNITFNLFDQFITPQYVSVASKK